MRDPIQRYMHRSARFERGHRLRMMTAFETFDLAIVAYRAIARDVLPRAVFPAALSAIAINFTISFVFPALWQTNNPDQVGLQILEFIGVIALGLVVAFPLFAFGVAWCAGMTTRMVAAWLQGKEWDGNAVERETLRNAGPSMLNVVFAGLHASSGLLICVLLLIVSGLIAEFLPQTRGTAGVLATVAVSGLWLGGLLFAYLVARLSLAIPAAIVENLRPKDARARSAQLMRREGILPSGYNSAVGQWFLASFVLLALALGFSTILQLVGGVMGLEAFVDRSLFGAILGATLGALPWLLGFWLLIPGLATGLTVLYFERRVRMEGYDIEQLANDLHDRRRRFDVRA
ncbi:MAG: hypothetical protein SFX74_00205 [Fimbriimonadaceae bacterium]|nr:hypothetical protein [Fimbriimonadaceae bacterium]